MKRVLVSNLMMLKERQRFEKALDERGCESVWAAPRQYLSEAECLDLVGDIDGWLCGDDQITRKVMGRALPRLKVLSKWGTGVDSIDLDAAREFGIHVRNTPGAFAQAVAEVAIHYFLSLSRHLVAIDRNIRAGSWTKPQGRELKGAQVGIIGFGAIGRRIGELAAAFGMKVRFFDPALSAPVALPLGEARPMALEKIAATSDFVCLACNYSPTNHHLIDAAFLAQMKPSAFLVNVARGPLVDEHALIAALERGTLAGAGLDVFEAEPLEPDNPLLRMENTVLGSHNANNARGAVELVHENTLKNLFEFLE